MSDWPAMIAARDAFPASRGMTALDQVLQGLVDGKGKAERVIVKTLAAAAGLVLLGWTLGHKP